MHARMHVRAIFDSSCPTNSENECGVTSRYQCIDPAASCVDDDDVDSSMVNSCSIDSIGDGYCDWYTNNQEQCGA